MTTEWGAIEDRFGPGTLILGNGSSQAVYSGFTYRSLLTVAESLPGGFGGQPRELFAEFDTVNFEEVLRHVQSAARVAAALGEDSGPIEDVHEEVRSSLIAAVREVHVPWPEFRSIRDDFRSAVEGYSSIFSLNYDLLLYWAIMAERGGEGFKDGFWNPGHAFDWSDAEFWGDDTRVFYPHGGLHLERARDGSAVKRTATQLASLLDDFGPDFQAGTTPLFVSEGTSEAKERAILGSDYLFWCLEELARSEGPLTVFGAALGSEDEHIARAVNHSDSNPIAVAVHDPQSKDMVALKKWRKAQFPHKKVILFDSDTHPLGAADLELSP